MTDEMNIGDLLAEQLERLFANTVNRDLLIEVEQGKTTDLSAELEGLGVISALISEEQGGVGLTWADAEPAIKVAGRHAAPVPLTEGLLAHWALANSGIEVPEGPITISTEIFTLNEDDTVTGEDKMLAWAEQSQSTVLVAMRGDERFVCLLEPSTGQLSKIETIAREPQSRLTLNGAKAVAVKPAPSSIGELGLLPFMASMRAVQIGGALEQLLALCVEYGNTREQFGRPIGKFQAIQHAIAELASQCAAAQVAGLYALRQIDAGNSEKGAMVAKTRTGQAATRGTEIAHQVFGAIGFTDEHTLHYFTRRLWQWRSDAGSDFWWSEQLGKQTVAAGGDALWPSIAEK